MTDDRVIAILADLHRKLGELNAAVAALLPKLADLHRKLDELDAAVAVLLPKLHSEVVNLRKLVEEHTHV